MKFEVFNKELNYIKNERILESAKRLLEILPDYFYHVEASSTGKYHPEFTIGECGLVRHTKAAVRIAFELLSNKTFGDFYTDDEKDLIILSLLIHDGLKLGTEKNKYTKFEHPLLIKEFIIKNSEILQLDKKELTLVCSMVSTHMGQWNTNDYSSITLPLPTSKYERFVHMCDFLASRKFLNIKFSDNEIED